MGGRARRKVSKWYRLTKDWHNSPSEFWFMIEQLDIYKVKHKIEWKDDKCRLWVKRDDKQST